MRSKIAVQVMIAPRATPTSGASTRLCNPFSVPSGVHTAVRLHARSRSVPRAQVWGRSLVVHVLAPGAFPLQVCCERRRGWRRKIADALYEMEVFPSYPWTCAIFTFLRLVGVHATERGRARHLSVNLEEGLPSSSSLIWSSDDRMLRVCPRPRSLTLTASQIRREHSSAELW